jgi:zinc and cadmium transporter
VSPSTWLYIAVAILLDGCAGLAGGVMPERWIVTRRPALVGFASGVLLGVVFLDLLPEALAKGSSRAVLGTALASFTAMACLEWWLGHRRSRHSAQGPLPIMLLGSDALHNIGDGAAIAASFLASPRLGVVTAFAVIVHEVPEEIGDYALLRRAGMRRGSALLAMAAVQLTAAIGAVATVLAASTWEMAAGWVLGLAAGTFLYIGATDLLPEVLHERAEGASSRQAVLGFAVGIAVAVTKTLV